MRNWKSLGASIVVVLLLVLAQWRASDEPAMRPNDPALDRVASAEQEVRILEAREAAGEAITPTFFELKLSWQHRAFEARLEAATTDEAKLQVAQRRVAQTRKALDRRFSVHGTPPQMRARQALDLADAEFRFSGLGG